MNTNIFDFLNSESPMQFNPLFLPGNSFIDSPGTVKSFKISNSSYLFSDIIKVFAGNDLVKNLDLKLNLPSGISSKQIPAGNIFSFNLSDINDLKGLHKASDNSSFNLKDIIALITKFFQGDQSNSVQGGITQISNNTENDSVLTGDKLRVFLNELNHLVQNTDGNSDNEKIKTDKDIKKIVSKILESLNNCSPVLINIIGNNQTLKIELNKTEIAGILNSSGTHNYKENDLAAGLTDENTGNINSNVKINNEEIQTNELNISAEQTEPNLDKISAGQTEQSSNSKDAGQTEKNRDIITAAQTKNNSKADANTTGSDEIEKLISELGGKETKVLEDDKTVSSGNKRVEENSPKTFAQKTGDQSKSFSIDTNSGKNNSYKLNFEIVNNEKDINRIKNNSALSNSENFVKQSEVIAKSKSDSLTIENLVASKSSLKDISKLSKQTNNNSVDAELKIIHNVKIETDNIPVETKTQQGSMDTASLNLKNDLRAAEGNNNIREFPGTIKLDEKIPVQDSGTIKSEQIDDKKPVDKDKNNDNKIGISKPGNPKSERLKIQTSTYDYKKTRLNSKPDLQESQDISKESTDAGKNIQAAEGENQPVNQKGTITNSQSGSSIKIDNTAKITPNNPSQNNPGDNFSGTKQDSLNSEKGRDQISVDRSDNAFSSYLNKIDVNNIQDIKKPAYLNNIADQMKTIDSNEIVKEISKLASDKDQRNIVLKLVPETLGKVKILLDVSNNIIHAHAEVENEAAKSLMQNNLGNLKQALAQQGMQLNSLNISLSNHQEQKSNKSYLSKKKFSYSEAQIGEIEEKEHATVSKHYGYNTYEFLA